MKMDKEYEKLLAEQARLMELQEKIDSLKLNKPVTSDGYVAKDTRSWRKTHFWNKGLSFMNRLKLRRKPDSCFIVTMRHKNMTEKDFVIATNEEMFRYKGKWYHINPSASYYNLTQKQNKLIYDERFHEPMQNIQQDGNEIFFSVTPDNVKPLIDMNNVKILAMAGELDRYLKFALIVSIIGVIIMIVVAYLIHSQGAEIKTLNEAMIQLLTKSIPN